jgi:gamma-glutamyltranspeptidase
MNVNPTLPGTMRYGRQGMICSASSEAAAAGARVLLEGGNAFDATVAVALVEGLTPTATATRFPTYTVCSRAGEAGLWRARPGSY